MIFNLVFFGASGDLTGRFLLPALATMRATARFPDELVIVGTARPRWDEEEFRAHAADRLAEHAALDKSWRTWSERRSSASTTRSAWRR